MSTDWMANQMEAVESDWHFDFALNASRGQTLAAVVYGDETTDSGARRIVRHLGWHADFLAKRATP